MILGEKVLLCTAVPPKPQKQNVLFQHLYQFSQSSFFSFNMSFLLKYDKSTFCEFLLCADGYSCGYHTNNQFAHLFKYVTDACFTCGFASSA